MHDVENVAGDAGFWTALALAAVGVALVLRRLRFGHSEPGVAVAVSLACLVGLRVGHRMPVPLVVAVVLLVLGDWVTRESSVWIRVLGAVPGALVLGAALPVGWPFWIRVAVVGSTVVGGVLADRADRIAPRVVPLLLAVGAAGVYLCVPDTEAPKVLMGALAAGAFVLFAPRLRATVGVIALTGLFVWIVGVGGLGRPGSVVGGIACLGVVLVIPLVGSRVHTWVLIATQCALVLFVSRVAGLEGSAWSALGLCVAGFALAGAVLAVAGGRPESSGV